MTRPKPCLRCGAYCAANRIFFDYRETTRCAAKRVPGMDLPLRGRMNT